MKEPYINLAQQAIKYYLDTGKILDLPAKLPKTMTSTRAGAFVSLHHNDNRLRGCIGTFLPTQKCVAQEIIANAIAAATEDPRFPPVKIEELDDLEISVDILSKPKKLNANSYSLDPKKYGLIVSTADARRGLLLPDITGVETAEQQIEICKQKGGIGPREPVQYQTFTVERHR